MIFSRRRGSGRHAKDEAAKAAGAVSVADKSDDRRARRAALLADLDLAEADQPADTAPPARKGFAGPYDIADAPPGERIDFGSLLIPEIDDVEIRMQATDAGVVQQLALVHGGNTLQLAVFAAPRTDGLWDEWRAEIRKSLFDDGVASDEVRGRWGTELRARVRIQDGFADLRFIGIDGPRWMVHGALQGPAAADPALAGSLNDCLSGLVVRRGEEARPTREALPMRVPEQARPAGEADPQAQDEPLPQPPEPAPPRRKPSPRPRRD